MTKKTGQIFKLLLLLVLAVSLFTFHIFYGLSSDDMGIVILYQIRLPRAALAVIVGGGLGVSGVILQGIFKNNLVEPYTLGISGGAAVGVALGLAFIYRLVQNYYILSLCGLLGAFLALFVLYVISMKESMISTSRILLVGIMISLTASSILMLILSITRAEDLTGIIYWMMGSLDEPRTELIYLMGVVSVAGLSVSLFISKKLNAIQLGVEKAFSLGIDVEKTFRLVVVTASVITAFAVSTVGMIPFVGLIAPHIVRGFVGNDNRFLTIGAYIGGGILLLASDIIARIIIAPNELPIGVITGLLGGFIFINMFKKKRL
jgi:iron complex transport system permease protein